MGTGDDNTCNAECFQKKRYHVTNYRYIGGWYGACDEHAMMMELQRGPIVVAINAPGDLFYYSKGVYQARLDTSASAYDVNGMSRWEKTNHAVTAVGWGEEMQDGKTIKYWLIKNSWGKQWGQGGY